MDSMADIFISYAIVDRPFARRLAYALEAYGWSVWWDYSNIDEAIRAIHRARVVLVVWSKTSIESAWVRNEAALALEEGKLVLLQIDMTYPTLTLGFRRFHIIDFSSWAGQTEAEPFEPFDRLVKELRRHLALRRTLVGAPRKEDLLGFPDLARRLTDRPPQIHDAKFTVYHPKEITPERWDTLLVYAHISEMREWVYKDAQARLGQPGTYFERSDQAKQDIAKGAEILVVPELPGCQFNPPVDRFHWFEDVHRREFRLRPTTEVSRFEIGKAVNPAVPNFRYEPK